MGKDTGQEQIQTQAEKQVLVAREQQASLKTSIRTCTLTRTHTHRERGDHASLPLRDIMKHLWQNSTLFPFF